MTAPPSLRRRLACNLYELLLLSAVLLVAAFPFVAVTSRFDFALIRPYFQVYLLFVAGCYFTLFWRKGQTLAMKTWRLRLETAEGGHAHWGQVWLRYVLCCCNLACLGMGWWAALWHPQRQFLQDRLAGTRLVSTT